jgi:hypothetical protein
MVRATIATAAGSLLLEGTPKEVIEVITLLAERGLHACQEQAPDDLAVWQMAPQEECQVANGASPSAATCEFSLNEAKDLHEGKFTQCIDEEVNEKTSMDVSATHVAPPWVATPEQSLNDVKGLHDHRWQTHRQR